MSIHFASLISSILIVIIGIHAEPAMLKSMKESRNPDAVQRWLDAQVQEGFDRKAIRVMLRMSSEELSQVNIHFLGIDSWLRKNI
jgi:hypothetical protein